MQNQIGISVCMTFCAVRWRWTTTLHLSLPAGWEGGGLHQPPWVQNRPSHRVQTEIVSVPHMSPKLLIKHICFHPHNMNAHTPITHTQININQSSSLRLTAVPSKPVIPKSRASSSPQIVLRKWTGEWVGVSVSFLSVCLSEQSDAWERHVSFYEYFSWVNQVYTRPTQHCAWIRHEPSPLLLNVELCMCL